MYITAIILNNMPTLLKHARVKDKINNFWEHFGEQYSYRCNSKHDKSKYSKH